MKKIKYKTQQQLEKIAIRLILNCKDFHETKIPCKEWITTDIVIDHYFNSTQSIILMRDYYIDKISTKKYKYIRTV